MTELSSRSYTFGAVVPAAGLSRRMGAFKPLLPYGGSTVIESAVGSALSCVEQVVVVLGKRADELRTLLERRFGSRVVTVLNPHYTSCDMLTSVQLGLRAMGACDGFFLLPGDMPAITPSVYQALGSAFNGEREVIYPVRDGRRGHPPLLHSVLIPEILSYEGDGGLREILRRFPAYEVLSDSGILVDLDTPGDYERIMRER